MKYIPRFASSKETRTGGEYKDVLLEWGTMTVITRTKIENLRLKDFHL